MPSLRSSIYYIFHPQELRAMVQWGMWHNPVHERDEAKEDPSLRRCFQLLDMTSRSFAAVIKELNHELLNPICIFYLVLRGLDTIEDDMTIPLKKKDPLLRDFYSVLDQDGWTFNDNGPNEKDRQLLVEFHCVITEFQKIKPAYRDIIKDIAMRMGDGMADYQNDAELNEKGIETIVEYEKYCHYVAGLVGEGLTRLFVESGLANPALLKRPDLHESMGQFLQQTNIIRDIREDMDDKRRFWPSEVWSKYVDKFEDLFKKENEEAALRCSSEMVLLALDRADDCLFYLAGIRDQSVFNFAAIPQAMAIATLELVFRNPNIFQKNVKITKGQACQLMLLSTQNLEVLYGAFRDYARKIHKKNDPRDPNFLKISIACGKIEQFIESIFPTQGPRIVNSNKGGASTGAGPVASNATPESTPEQVAEARRQASETSWEVFFVFLAVLCVVLLMTGIMAFIAWMLGARFDLAWEQLKQGSIRKLGAVLPPTGTTPEHAEL